MSSPSACSASRVTPDGFLMRFDLPSPDFETQPYWDALAESRLLIRRCRTCDAWHFYPRPFCPKCWSADVDWVEAAGTGVVYTCSVVRVNDLPPFPEKVPYVAAIVELDEGPRMMTNIVGCPPESVEIGMRVRVEFVPLDDEITIPVFRPVPDAGS
jgi:uncharacterized OB-fold protein